jgi:hypothetical protein
MATRPAANVSVVGRPVVLLPHLLFVSIETIRRLAQDGQIDVDDQARVRPDRLCVVFRALDSSVVLAIEGRVSPALTRDFRARYRSIGTPTSEPHSVQDPS